MLKLRTPAPAFTLPEQGGNHQGKRQIKAAEDAEQMLGD